MHLSEQDWAESEKMIAAERKKNKENGAYFAAVMYLTRGETQRASAEIDVLRQLAQNKKSDKRLEMRLWEVQGWLLCQNGSGESGLKLLKRAVDKTKGDYFFHSWGGGAYFMEVWGMAALECGNATEAEEAFLEALAHDAGSVRAALGLQAMCERLGRNDEAVRYSTLARRCWSKAESRHLEMLRQEMQRRASKLTTEAALK
jgi:Tfp pilus assembly protein PilF